MKKFVREKTIFGKKLVKTTTFAMALLIVATLIFSSVVSAIGVNVSSKQTYVKEVQKNNPAPINRISKDRISSEMFKQGTNTPQNPAPLGVPILTEGFEGSWLPAGWAKVQTNPGPGSGSIPPYWSQTTYDFHSGANAAGLWWDYAHQDEWLITPQVALTGSTTGNYYIKFWTYGYEGSIYDDHYYVKISTNNGTTWTPLFDLSDLTGNAWNDWAYPYDIALNAYAGQTVKLAFHAIDCNDPSNPNYPGLWYVWIIDDVEIGYFDIPDHDVGTVSIDSPVTGPAGVIAPKVTVNNYGSNAETFNLNVKIGTYLAPNQIYSQSWEVLNTFPPTNWVVRSNDAYPATWVKATDQFHGGTKSAKCTYQTLFDDWLVTKPSIVPTSGAVNFSVWIKGYNTADAYQIWKSTTGNTVNDFLVNGTMLANVATGSSTWTLKTFNMAANAGQPVWYAVRYQGTSSQWYLWADDFTFPDGTTQGFEYYDIPNWNTVKVSGTSTYNDWTVVATSTSPTASPHDGTKFMKYYSYMAPAGQSNRLYMDTTSLNFAATALDVIQMKLWMFHDTVVQTATLQVQASTDKINWTTLATIPRYDGSSGWKEHTIDFSTYATQSTVYIGFLGTADYYGNIYIDDFKMFASGVTWNAYNKNISVSLNVGETKQITCPNWTPAAWHNQQNVSITYPIKAETQLVGDSVPSNNVKQKDFTLSYPFFYDVQSVSIISPATSGPAQKLPVKTSVKNVGQYPVNTFWVNTKITEIAYTTLLNENFESSWGPMGNNPPAGWTITTNEPTPITWDTNNWHKYAYGGTQGSVARIYWTPVRSADDSLITPTLNCVGLSSVNLQFWNYFYYYSAASYGYVDGSINGGSTWFNIDTYHSTQTAGVKSYDISLWAAGQANVKIRFRYVDYDGLYWNVDDVKVFSQSYTLDYSDSAPVYTVLNPGETRELTYPTEWTPGRLLTGIPGSVAVYDYQIKATSQYPGDGNPANDITTKTITLTYQHDVGVKKISSPAKGERDLLFHQRYFETSESWIFRSSNAGGGYMCQDDFWDLTASINNIEFYGLCLIYNAGWTPGNANTLPFEVKFYEDNAGVPGTIVATFPLAAITPVNTGLLYSGFTMYYWNYNLPTSVVLTDGWISIQSQTAPDNAWLLLSGSPEGNQNMYQQGASPPQIVGDCAFNLSGQSSPYPPVSIYLAPGTKPINGIVNNLGTFAESDLTCYAEIWKYMNDPNGTVDYTDDIGDIALDPLGDEETLNFASYDFQDEGIYGLFLNLPLANDNVPGNNIKSLGIGVDTTPPVSTHALTPEAPDGTNGWYVHDVTVKITSDDPESNSVSSGVKEIRYKVDTGGWNTQAGDTATIKVTTDGNHTVYYYGVDNVNNQGSQKSVSFKMDKTKPVVVLAYEVLGGDPTQGYEIKFTATATDVTSTMDRVEFYLNDYLQTTVPGPGPAYEWTILYYPLPNVAFRATGYDKAGNFDSDIIDKVNNQHQPHSQPGNSQKILRHIL